MEGSAIQVGEVFYLPLGRNERIEPGEGYSTRNKYLIVLGFSPEGDVICGAVFNSRINQKLPLEIQQYHYPIDYRKYSFLSHQSFVDCSSLIPVSRNKFRADSRCGQLDGEDLGYVLEAVVEAPTTRMAELVYFGLLPGADD